MIKPLIKLAIATCLLFSQPVFSDSGFKIENVWIAEAPPVSKVLAGYMEIENESNQAVNIISAESENFERIEFHQISYQKNLARMQQLERLSIPAKSELEFEVGKHHMMLFNPVKKLKAGNKVNFVFKLDNGKLIKATAIVKKHQHSHSHQHH